MKILYSPSYKLGSKFTYQFSAETITATYEGASDTFNLSSFSEGNIFQGIKTTLPYDPISYIERKNGILEVQLVNFIDDEATHEEQYPEWIEV